MSFSSDVKEELSRQQSTSRHCQIAEIAAIISMCGRIGISAADKFSVKIHTENAAVARKYFTLLKKTFNINTEISIRRNIYLKKNRVYIVAVTEHKNAMRILEAIKLIDANGDIKEELSIQNNVIIQKACCKRAFVRGAFLASGSFSDPEKFYHFEIVCQVNSKAEQLKSIIQSFGVEAKITRRKKYFIVYIKDSSGIVDILNIIEAHQALMDLENIRILKEMRNTVNRKVNCETANINKTISAAVKQVQDIKTIEAAAGLDSLPANLQEMAELRIDHPDATLKELGEMFTPPIGKSGVNHRLRKLSELADKLRPVKEEEL